MSSRRSFHPNVTIGQVVAWMAGRGPLWVALAVLLHFTTLCRAEYGICNIPCCSLTPNCSDALLVDCDCPDLDSVRTLLTSTVMHTM